MKKTLKSLLILNIFFTFSLAAEDFYQAKNYESLIGMPGFDDNLLRMHFTLYQGYVKNTNLLLEKLKGIAKDSYEYGAMKRRFGWEYDGMRLHEYYFENMGGKKSIDSQSLTYRQLARAFGSFDTWKEDFIATGMMRGIGWSVLYRDLQTGRLINVWINEHDLGHLAGGALILVMDVFEHAYMPQFGLDRKKYVEVFFNNIQWDIVEKRLRESLK